MSGRWINKYKEMLLQSEGWEKITEHVKPNRPRYLYKYMPIYIEENKEQFWKKNLFDGQLYCGAANKLNDPYDCYLNIDTTKLFYEKGGRERFLQNNPKFNPELIKNRPPENIYKCLEENIFKDIQSEMRVASFTDDPTNILMWSHYANSSKGICIKYDTKKIEDKYLNRIFPVIYDKKRHDLTDSITENPFCFLFLKSHVWRYENEWRIAIWKREVVENPLSFKKAICGVIVGGRCERKNRVEIKNWCSENEVRYMEAKFKKDEYVIEI